MQNEDMLARLMAQAQGDGADMATLRAIIEESSELGADRLLNRFALSGQSAQADLTELRELLQAWRDAKASAWKQVATWFVRGALALLLIGIAVRLGFGGMLS